MENEEWTDLAMASPHFFAMLGFMKNKRRLFELDAREFAEVLGVVADLLDQANFNRKLTPEEISSPALKGVLNQAGWRIKVLLSQKNQRIAMEGDHVWSDPWESLKSYCGAEFDQSRKTR